MEVEVPSFDGRQWESRYRVDEFRRFLPGRGSSGKGLVQFWGPRYNRVDRGPWEEKQELDNLRTVEVSEIKSIRDPK